MNSVVQPWRHDSKHPLRTRFLRVFSVILLVVLLCPLLLCGAVIGAEFLSEPLARSMTPPTYPNSQLINTYRATGSWGYTEFNMYSTSDSVSMVENWYGENASHLKRISQGNGSSSFEALANNKLTTHIVEFIIAGDWNPGPSAYLHIDPDPKNPDLTQITTIVAWPAL